jgi:hypothetical protein
MKLASFEKESREEIQSDTSGKRRNVTLGTFINIQATSEHHQVHGLVEREETTDI